MSYVDRVSSSVIKTIDGRLTEETIDISDVYWECDTDITTAVPGSYIVTFWTENSAGIIGYTYMTVIKIKLPTECESRFERDRFEKL